MDKKKEVKYFISEFDRVNEGLEHRNLDADAVISILQLSSDGSDNRDIVFVYYKE